jgi:crotonobetainyl-CoA:carnitine CoA-transferase CaiB-like acyl-CoA transferase
VFITNLHPSVLEKLGMDWESLAPENPRLIYAHATGYGDQGAEVEKPGYDATAWWARSGLMDAVRPNGAEFALATAGMGDHPSAMALFGAIALALFDRERTGKGRRVRTSLCANGAWSNSILIQAALCGGKPYVPPTHAGSGNSLVNHYVCSCGRGLYLAMVQEPVEWERFTRAIGKPELAQDPRFKELPLRRANAPALTKILDEVFASRSLSDWRAELDRHQITFGVIQRIEDLPHDPQLAANGILREMSGPGVRPGLRTVDSPIQLDGVSKAPARRPPALGEHGREILQSIGYGPDRIAALVRDGVLRE